jgi:SAM-dependent methyltransferase
MTTIREGTTGSADSGSSDRFGYEWNVYSELRPEYEEQFRGWTAHLMPEDWKGRVFLDVGCGMGRNSVWPIRYGAIRGVAADIDDRSLAAAARTLAPYPTVQVLHCSAYDLPFRDEFDIAFAIGVIHHLEFPERALAKMVEAVKPGGHVMIWVYGRENNGWLLPLLNPLRKALFSRVPVSVTHHLSLYPSALLWLLVRLGLQPTAYFRLIASFGFRHLRSIVFDQMLPRIAHYWSREEVAALMEAAGLDDVRLAWVNEMSWAAIGTKAAAA